MSDLHDSVKTKRSPGRLGVLKSNTKLLIWSDDWFLARTILPASCFFFWFENVLTLAFSQQWNLTGWAYDIWLARTGAPETNHATSYLVLLLCFPMAYLVFRNVVPAFFLTIATWGFHETSFQFPYWAVYHSALDFAEFWKGIGLDLILLAIIFGVLWLYEIRWPWFYAVWLGPWLLYLGAWTASGFPITVMSHLANRTPSFAATSLNGNFAVNFIEVNGWLLIVGSLAAALALQVLHRLSSNNLAGASRSNAGHRGEDNLPRRGPLRRGGYLPQRSNRHDYVQLRNERNGDSAPALVQPASSAGRNRGDRLTVPTLGNRIDGLTGAAQAVPFLFLGFSGIENYSTGGLPQPAMVVMLPLFVWFWFVSKRIASRILKASPAGSANQ